jgi:hypothetical protein
MRRNWLRQRGRMYTRAPYRELGLGAWWKPTNESHADNDILAAEQADLALQRIGGDMAAFVFSVRKQVTAVAGQGGQGA